MSRLAIISGSVAFFAPEIGMVPLSVAAADDANPIHAHPLKHDPESGYRFPAFAKPASAGEARSGKIMLNNKLKRNGDLT